MSEENSIQFGRAVVSIQSWSGGGVIARAPHEQDERWVRVWSIEPGYRSDDIVIDLHSIDPDGSMLWNCRVLSNVDYPGEVGWTYQLVLNGWELTSRCQLTSVSDNCGRAPMIADSVVAAPMSADPIACTSSRESKIASAGYH